MKAVVYIAINIMNGKRYVGVTQKTLHQRRRQHFKHAFAEGRKVKFHCALRKYGKENFQWAILAEYKRWEDALAGEIYFIAEMKPEYNMTPGGEGNTSPRRSNLRKVVCLDDGRVFESVTSAAKHYGVRISRIVAVCKGYGTGKTTGGLVFRYFGEHAGGLLEANRIRAGIPKRGSWRQRKILCVEDKKIFADIEACAKAYNVSGSAIRAVCNGKYQLCRGKRFVFYVGQDTNNLPPLKYVEKHKKKVLRVEDNMIFDSVGACASFHGLSKGYVASICRGTRAQRKHKTFTYVVSKTEKAA